ncbi:IclR family transcriptional regulator [Alicyclobacillus acidocaldarius]|uniref:Glycerol operon regulatory protein n=1 Tax=Alicyclobacillus acidocaldarius (strain Tc-4-1) TaxID=1048834 RepID=F8ID76_ALIAT|nr:IclR family transcriptional regulator [Alicyclobacillus acidocaldarius]AEJ42542.1 transcriptional regulator, IclR family [Alicyclobacillus acidocaldarius subsp. acidocaldarius Tc-4-1]
MPHTPSGQTTVRAVERALDILLLFTHSPRAWSLSEIARATGLHKSTVHRLLLALQQKGFVRREPESDRYVLGWSLYGLGANLALHDRWSDAAKPILRRLRDETNETVSLYVRNGLERIRILAVESLQPIRNVASVGERYPLTIGASGKVLLAFSNSAVIEAACHPDRLPNGVRQVDLRQQLEAIRREGYALSRQERDAGAAAIAAPVLNRDGTCLYAIAVSGPVERMTEDKMRDMIAPLKRAAEELSKQLAE